MNYYSTNNKSHKVSLQQAVVQGLAADNGLFMPESIPALRPRFFQSLHEKSFQEIAFEVASALVGEELPLSELQKIVKDTISFDAPLVNLNNGIYALELFHGPTLAFKDFGARFLAGLLGYYAQHQAQEMTVLVATSGDTGSAVANGFFNVEGVKVIVLYPSGKVSDLQEKQFTTLGGNITALEIDGTFDDCQRLVKEAFLDVELQRKKMLTSANSINIARLIPQSFYYFWAAAQLNERRKEIVFAVPSGNFGNITAGLLAKRMGLPQVSFIACTNANDIVPTYLQTGVFQPRPSISTISNAMDVGNPSNFARILDLYDHDLSCIQSDIQGFTATDKVTQEAMMDVYVNEKYIMDPHGAIGYLGLKELLNTENQIGVFLETAHPGKFKEVVENSILGSIAIPERLQLFFEKKKQAIQLKNSFEDFKDYILNN